VTYALSLPRLWRDAYLSAKDKKGINDETLQKTSSSRLLSLFHSLIQHFVLLRKETDFKTFEVIQGLLYLENSGCQVEMCCLRVLDMGLVS
jgi:hypothetical protein